MITKAQAKIYILNLIASHLQDASEDVKTSHLGLAAKQTDVAKVKELMIQAAVGYREKAHEVAQKEAERKAKVSA